MASGKTNNSNNTVLPESTAKPTRIENEKDDSDPLVFDSLKNEVSNNEQQSSNIVNAGNGNGLTTTPPTGSTPQVVTFFNTIPQQYPASSSGQQLQHLNVPNPLFAGFPDGTNLTCLNAAAQQPLTMNVPVVTQLAAHTAANLTHNLIPLAQQQQLTAAAALVNSVAQAQQQQYQQKHRQQQQLCENMNSMNNLNSINTASPFPTLIPSGNLTIPSPLPNQSPILTVQDHPLISPVYNGVNPNYPGLRVLHQNPPIFAVDNFLSHAECDFLINVAQDSFSPAPVVGKGAGEVSPSRTSSTCYLAREDLPEYLKKVMMLTGKPVEHCELPQVGRYFPSQQYLQHFDAFDLSNEDGRRFASNGGQRTVTVLVYLNDVNNGGGTAFPALNLEVRPRKGMAIVFFPATVDGLLDKLALHAALPAIDVKYVSQVWIRQGNYEGMPSKRIFASVEQASVVQKGLIAMGAGISAVTNNSNPQS